MSSWTTPYRTWTGSFSELVAEANAILAADYPGSEPITERTARHYQQEGLLGKGTKTGRSAQFGYEDLAALVNAKTLARQVGLKMVGALNTAYAPSEVSAQYASATSASVGSSVSANAAMVAVAQLMAKAHPAADLPSPVSFFADSRLSGASPHLHLSSDTVDVVSASRSDATPLTRSLGQLAGARFAQGAVGATLPTKAFTHHTPTDWLTVALDDTAATTASPSDRQRAALTLRTLAHRLDPQE